MNGNVYLYCLKKLGNVDLERRIGLQHDNATAHSAVRTREFLQASGVKLLGHPPYSPDLAPCDFFLFPETKKKLRGRTFSTPDEAVAAFLAEVEAIPKEVYRDAFSKWFHRMSKCIEHGGEYFEKL